MLEPTSAHLEALLAYYEEEIIGEAIFCTFAERLNDSHQAQKMHLLAGVEHHAANAPKPQGAATVVIRAIRICHG